ncbi:uncharacterized protein LOC120345291 [Styela clava]|uniref:uncharacterized protein LOC120345291 n=1 Tax=Styela clava TaxID=7725 RepID=UPI00193ABD7E|nr:uncharacterized protein LOC120345291 [Styela clava]
MHSVLSTALIVGVLIGYVAAACYREVGCSSTWGKGRTYRIGQRWKPKSDPCYVCKCVKAKKIVLKCQVAIDEHPKTVKKSLLSARFESMSVNAKNEDIKITRKEAKTIECPPIRAPIYNWATGTFEPITYKNVYYYYIRRVSSCCSRFIGYTSVHPACKVVKISKCRSKAVRKDNPQERCNLSMRYVG